MTSFAKYVAVLTVGLIAVAGWPGNAADDPSPKAAAPSPTPKKKNKKPKTDEEAPPKKGVDVPVEKGHPSKGLTIPYFSNDGKRQMNFKIGMASRIDENHLDLKDLQIETFDENEKHEMDIFIPNSILDTDTSVITTRQHVTINREDFELTGESMIFNTRTKQGGLGGNVHMVIYNLDKGEDDTADKPAAKEK